MTKKGLFFCALNLPLVTAGCAVVFQTSRQLVQLVAAMACLKAFTQLNFGFTRTLWYAVPDAVRTLAYAVIGDFVRFETFSICRNLRFSEKKKKIKSPLQMPGAVKGLSAVGVLIMIDRGIRADGQKLMAGSLLVCALWSILLM